MLYCSKNIPLLFWHGRNMGNGQAPHYSMAAFVRGAQAALIGQLLSLPLFPPHLSLVGLVSKILTLKCNLCIFMNVFYLFQFVWKQVFITPVLIWFFFLILVTVKANRHIMTEQLLLDHLMYHWIPICCPWPGNARTTYFCNLRDYFFLKIT